MTEAPLPSERFSYGQAVKLPKWLGGGEALYQWPAKGDRCNFSWISVPVSERVNHLLMLLTDDLSPVIPPFPYEPYSTGHILRKDGAIFVRVNLQGKLYGDNAWFRIDRARFPSHPARLTYSTWEQLHTPGYIR